MSLFPHAGLKLKVPIWEAQIGFLIEFNIVLYHIYDITNIKFTDLKQPPVWQTPAIPPNPATVLDSETATISRLPSKP